MKSDVRISYDTHTGKIKGYYPFSLEYDYVKVPYIIVDHKTYKAVLGNEKKFKIQNAELLDISDTAEYQIEEISRLLAKGSSLISSLATVASSWGVLSLDDVFINVNWKSFYESFLASLPTSGKVKVKVYVLEDQEYKQDYKELTVKKAAEFLKTAIESIDSYRNQYIPQKQSEYLEELRKLSSSKSLSAVSRFVESISYGYTINETFVSIPFKL